MPGEKDIECAECGSVKGHRLSCVSGNKQAAKYQSALERKLHRSAAKELAEIRDCDKCDLCEDHHE